MSLSPNQLIPFTLMRLTRSVANWKSLSLLMVGILTMACFPVSSADRCVMKVLVSLLLSVLPIGRIRILSKSFTCPPACSKTTTHWMPALDCSSLSQVSEPFPTFEYLPEENTKSLTYRNFLTFDSPTHMLHKSPVLMPRLPKVSSTKECWFCYKFQKPAGSLWLEWPMRIFAMGFIPYPTQWKQGLFQPNTKPSTFYFIEQLVWSILLFCANLCAGLLSWSRFRGIMGTQFQKSFIRH